MTPEQQQQFNQELQMVIAVAAQMRGHYTTHDNAVMGAFELIQAAERLLKGHYEPAKEAPVQASTGVGATSDRVGQGAGEPAPAVSTGTPKPSRKTINESISAASKIIVGQKRRTLEDLQMMVRHYGSGAQRKEQLTDEQAMNLLNQLQEILK